MDSSVLVSNCIIAKNTGTNISGEYSGSNNFIGGDPLFVDPDNGDYRLRADSPCVNAGNNSLAVDADGNPLTIDLAGNARISGGTVDIGAYEFACGNLLATVRNTDGVAVEGADAVIYQKSGDGWIEYDRLTTNSVGVASFQDIPVGSYNVEAYYNGEFWGSKWDSENGAVEVTADSNAYPQIYRAEPYAYDFSAKKDGQSVIGGNVYLGDELTYSVNIANSDASVDREVRIKLTLSTAMDGNNEFSSTSASKVIPASQDATFDFTDDITHIGDYHYSFVVETNINGNWVKTDSWDWDEAFSATELTISGNVRYEDICGIPTNPTRRWMDAREVTVELVDSTTQKVIATDYTNNEGYYVFDNLSGLVSNPNSLIVRVKAENYAGYYTIDSETVYYDLPITNIGSGQFNIDIDSSMAGAWNTVDVLLEGYYSVAGILIDSNEIEALKHLKVVYDANSTATPAYTNIFDFTTYLELTQSSYFSYSYQDSVLLHEYGHRVMDVAGYNSRSGGNHEWFKASDNTELAWSEGFANFFAAMVDKESEIANSETPGRLKFDNQSFDCEAIGAFYNNRTPSFYYEAEVAAFLWDIYDTVDDAGDTYSLADEVGKTRIIQIIDQDMDEALGSTAYDFYDAYIERFGDSAEFTAVADYHGLNVHFIGQISYYDRNDVLDTLDAPVWVNVFDAEIGENHWITGGYANNDGSFDLAARRDLLEAIESHPDIYFTLNTDIRDAAAIYENGSDKTETLTFSLNSLDGVSVVSNWDISYQLTANLVIPLTELSYSEGYDETCEIMETLFQAYLVAEDWCDIEPVDVFIDKTSNDTRLPYYSWNDRSINFFIGNDISHTAMAHEYGHAVYAYTIDYDWPDFENMSSHSIVTESNETFALVEGWAEFFAAVVMNNSSVFNTEDINYDLESGSRNPNMGYGASLWAGDIIGESSDWYNVDGNTGEKVEGAVASILWDIYDGTGNLDQDGDGLNSLWNEAWAIFCVYKPIAIWNSNGNSSDDFYHAWQILYGPSAELDRVFIDQGIPVADDTYDANDGNDSFGTAKSVEINTDISDLICVDQDWYKFTIVNQLEQNSTIALEYTPSQGNLDFALYDSSTQQLAFLDGINDSEYFGDMAKLVLDVSNLSSGIYYLKITGHGDLGSTNTETIFEGDMSPDYSLSLDMTESPELLINGSSSRKFTVEYGISDIGTKTTAYYYTFQNAGSADILIDNMQIAGDDADDYYYWGLSEFGQDSFTLAAGESQSIYIGFLPDNAGECDAVLTCDAYVNGEFYTDISFTLTGAGILQAGSRTVLSGWQDVEKILPDALSGQYPGTGDDYMCWAATASNLLYWGDWYDSAQFSTADDIFDEYIEYWTDGGYDTRLALKWWFDGEDVSYSGGTTAYNDVAGGGGYFQNIPYTDFVEILSLDSLMADIKTAIDNDTAIALSISSEDSSHAVSCWGYQLAGNEIVGLWLTDSDDFKNYQVQPDRLRYQSVNYNAETGYWDLPDWGYYIKRATAVESKSTSANLQIVDNNGNNSDKSIVFDDTKVGTHSDTYRFQLTNNGDHVLHISDLHLWGSGSSAFTLSIKDDSGNAITSVSFDIESGDTYSLYLQMYSDTEGEHEAFISFESNDIDNANITLSVAGTTYIELQTPVTYVVDTSDDVVAADGKLSLREAIEAANSNIAVNEAAAGSSFYQDTITFAAGLSGGTIVLSSQLTISEDLLIHGLGARYLALDANNNGRIFEVESSVELTIEGITLTGGYFESETLSVATSGGAILNYGTVTLNGVMVSGNTASGGGGILNFNGIVTINNSTIDNNIAIYGGGIYSYGFIAQLNIFNSTIAYNCATQSITGMPGLGGGIANNLGSMTIVNATIVMNNAAIAGGGIYNSQNSIYVTILNSIIAGNTTDSGGPRDAFCYVCEGDFYNNLIGYVQGFEWLPAETNIILGTSDIVGSELMTLDYYDSPVKVMPLIEGSMAINAGDDSYALDFNGNQLIFDSAGMPRFNGTVDIGAYEYYPVVASGIDLDLDVGVTNGKLLDMDGDGTPDTVMDVDGGQSYSVTNLSDSTQITVNPSPVNQNDPEVQITVNKADGWIYTSFADPFNGTRELLSITTSDGRVINPNNWWIDGNGNICVIDDPDVVYELDYENPTAAIVGRHIFYNNSSFDSVSDDNAIAADKQALLAGNKATFANYISYTRGLNGIMVDISGFAGSVTANDFTFRVGNSDTISAWTAAPLPASVTVRTGDGESGSDRIVIIWSDNAIVNKWLEVTVLANANTGLASNDVFYFGNAIGETGNSSLNASVNISDMALARMNQTGFTQASITNLYDFNRDKKVNVTDIGLARGHQSGFTPLRLIDLTASEGMMLTADIIAESNFSQAVNPQVMLLKSSETVWPQDDTDDDDSLLAILQSA